MVGILQNKDNLMTSNKEKNIKPQILQRQGYIEMEGGNNEEI